MTQDLYHAIFRSRQVSRVPVVILALLALAVIVAEFGAFLVELAARRRRRTGRRASTGSPTPRAARLALPAGRTTRPGGTAPVAWSAAMDATYAAFLAHASSPAPTRGSPRSSPTSTSAASAGSAAPGCWCGSARRSA